MLDCGNTENKKGRSTSKVDFVKIWSCSNVITILNFSVLIEKILTVLKISFMGGFSG